MKKICQSEALKEQIVNRVTSLQIVVLESLEDPMQRILVANTHLFSSAKADHIRVLQTATCIKFIEELLTTFTVSDKTPAVVFAGDFNSCPTSAAQNFIAKGFTSPDHEDWMKAGEEEYVGGLELKHSLRLSSACGYPEFTRYGAEYKECLDYIFISDDLEVEQVVPLPSEEELSLHSAIPSVLFPSDHVALVCDLKWK